MDELFTEAEKEAFLSRVDVLGPDDCWEWQGARQKPGPAGRLLPYGCTRWRGEQHGTHRLAKMMDLGRRIEPGLVVRHSCDNPPCCNPRHLLLGTQKDNVRDTIDRGRLVTRSYAPRRHINADKAAEIAAARLPSLAAMSRQFGYDRDAIRNALTKHGHPVPRRYLTDQEWFEIAAANLGSVAAIERRFGVAHASVFKHFGRLGLPIPFGGIEKVPDDCWREIAGKGFPSLTAAHVATGHAVKTIRSNFIRLGLPLPPGKHRRPDTTPTNPTKGA